MPTQVQAVGDQVVCDEVSGECWGPGMERSIRGNSSVVDVSGKAEGSCVLD